jgi:hypothetical protein
VSSSFKEVPTGTRRAAIFNCVSDSFPTFIAETKRAVKQIQWQRFRNPEEKGGEAGKR